jgi:hypothetical protein
MPGTNSNNTHHSTGEPLAVTAARLNPLSDLLAYRVGVPRQAGWLRFSDLTDAGLLLAWHRELTRAERDYRRAAFSMANRITEAATKIWALPVIADGRLPLAAPERAAIHLDGKGEGAGAAIEVQPLMVLPWDPAAGPGTVTASEREALLDALAERLVGISHVLEALHASLPIGLPALWSTLADSLGGWTLYLARLKDLDRQVTWRDIQGIISRISPQRPWLRARPRPFSVASPRGEELFQVRATCCLVYRTIANADPDGDGYCETCPLRTEGSRIRRTRAYLERRAAAG